MSSVTLFLLFIPVLAGLLLSINFIFAMHNPYKEKKTPFECGYHSFLSQNRVQFTISFFVFGILFLILDTEITLIYPWTVSSFANSGFGTCIMLTFAIIVTLGFVFEYGKGVLKIENKQDDFFNETSHK